MALWTPADAAVPPVFWLDAQNSANLAVSGGTVSNWNSRVGPGDTSQSDSARRPAYSATGLNGYPAVIFDGTSDYLGIGNKTGFPTGTAASTMAMIGGDGGGTGDRWIMVYGNDGQTRSIGQRDPAGFASLVELDGSPGFAELDNGGSYTGTGGFGVAVVSGGGSPVLTSTFDGGALQTLAASGAVANTTNSFGYIGAFGGVGVAGLYWTGPMQEILLWNVALATDDRQKLEGYLAWRWGQQGRLPAGHPYKAAAPTTGSNAYTLAAQSASVSTTNAQVTLRTTRHLPVGAGTAGLNGAPVSLFAARRLQGAAGSLAVSGEAARLAVARRLAASSAASDLLGRPAVLRAERRFIGSPGIFALIGNPAAFNVRGASAIAAGLGSFVASAPPVSLRLSRRIAGASAALALSSSAVALISRRTFRADPGGIAVTATAATLRQSATFRPVPTSRTIHSLPRLPRTAVAAVTQRIATR